MTHVASVDYDNKRIHCHADTVGSGFDIIAAYFEINALREANASGEQNRAHMLSAEGNIPKGGGNFTPNYGLLASGWRVVPYPSVSHTLSLTSEPVSADGLSGRDAFDRSTLSVIVEIDESYEKIEIREVNTGSGVDPADITDIANAVFGMVMEDGETFAEAMRLIRAEAAGSIVRSGDTHTIKSADGGTDRIVATANESGRTVTATDGA